MAVEDNGTPINYDWRTALDVPGALIGRTGDIAAAANAAIATPLAWLAGLPFGGVRGSKAAANAVQGDDFDNFGKNIWNPLKAYYGPQDGDTSTAVTAAAARSALEAMSPYKSTEDDLLRQQFGITGQAGSYASGATSAEERKLQDFAEYMSVLEPRVAEAQRKISGAYGSAADQARRQAYIFGGQGQQAAQDVRDVYGVAAQDVAALGSAGGTGVSGLTGPAQTFQSLYGSLPGTGVTEGQDITGGTGYAVGSLEELARKAASSGTKAGKDFATYINGLTAAEQYRLKSTMGDAQAGRVASYEQARLLQQAADQTTLDDATSTALSLWAQGGKAKKALEKGFGIDKNSDFAQVIDFYSSKYGPRKTAQALQQIQILNAEK